MPKFCCLPLVCLTLAAQALPPPQELKVSRDILDQAIKDKNPETRKEAAIALSLAAPEDAALTMLKPLLNDKDVEVRLAAIASIPDRKSPRTIAALRKALNDDVPEVSFAAAKGLYGLRDPEGKRALLAVLSGESATSSGYFTKQKRDALRMMHTPKTMFYFALKQGASLAPVPGLGAGVSSMQALLSDPAVSGRATAALLLGKEKDAASEAALRDALTAKEWSVRAAAVHSLSLKNNPGLRGNLAPLLSDKKEAVRLRAAAGYLRLSSLAAKSKAAPRKSARL